MISLMSHNWFGSHKNDKKTDEAVNRVVEARIAVTDAATRLVKALDITDSRMELTLGRLASQKRVRE